MAGNTTSNTSPVIKAQVYSEMILDEIKDGLLPEGLGRDVTDFGDGSTLYIPTLGEVVLRDLIEDQDTPMDAIDTGQISLTITEHVGAGSYVTDELKEDGYKAMAVESAIVPKHLRAIQERYETDLLAQAQKQTLSDQNTINGFNHRFAAGLGASATALAPITLEDFIYAKLALDKANIPSMGRIAIVDPVNEASINSITNLVNVSNNPMFEGIITEGMGKDMKFIKNIMGFDIWMSNRLPRTTTETLALGGAPAAAFDVTGGIVTQFMSMASDDLKPYMHAWRRMPRTAGDRNESKRRDEYYTTARWGMGLQRAQSLVTCVSHPTNY